MLETMKIILEKIKEYHRILLFRHFRPDGDAIGATKGLQEILRATYPEKEIYLANEDYSDYLAFLGEEDGEIAENQQKIEIKKSAGVASHQLEEELEVALGISVAGIVFLPFFAVHQVEDVELFAFFRRLFFQIVKAGTVIVSTQFCVPPWQ